MARMWTAFTLTSGHMLSETALETQAHIAAFFGLEQADIGLWNRNQ